MRSLARQVMELGAGGVMIALVGLDRSGVRALRFEPALHFRKHLVFPPGRPRPQFVRDFLGVLAEVRNRFALQLDNA